MRRLLMLVFTGVLAIVMTACGSTNHQPAGQRLKAARAFIDRSQAISFTLSTGDLPSGTDGVISASGTGTHQPGFSGQIKVVFSGTPISVPVRAVNGKVWAQVLGPWQVINPAQYGAPDPTALMSRTTGISSLLTQATGLDKGQQTRSGSAIVTTYTGQIAGQIISRLIPLANASAPFTVSFSLTDDNHLVKASITGPFFAHAAKVTYNLTLSPCGSCKPVTPPTS